MKISSAVILFFLVFILKPLPEGFSYVKEVIPGAVLEIRYAGSNNFVGKPIKGYEKPVAILSTPAALALKEVQNELLNMGYCLKIFDAYRPQRAVNHFMEWTHDAKDTLMKQEFYPNIQKKNLFRLDYIAAKSGHSRGSTVDLTLIDANTEEEIDMGGSYDFFGKISHHNSPEITPQQHANRRILKEVMEKHGFQSYYKEWWHYTYQPEPFPNKYFNFLVE